MEVTLNPEVLSGDYKAYQPAMTGLRRSGIPFLVGGSFALASLTPLRRSLKDLDILVRRADVERALAFFAAEGWRVERTHAHWLVKAIDEGGGYIDIIFSSGNGLCVVDDEWFQNALPARILGNELLVCPIEEMVWTKAYVMERDRFDGADIAHLLRSCAGRMDWGRLLRRFGDHWPLLLAHLLLFDFIYPSDRGVIPDAVRRDLLGRLPERLPAGRPARPLCRGTLLSAFEYEDDVFQGHEDARLLPFGNLTPPEVDEWRESLAREEEKKNRRAKA